MSKFKTLEKLTEYFAVVAAWLLLAYLAVRVLESCVTIF